MVSCHGIWERPGENFYIVMGRGTLCKNTSIQYLFRLAAMIDRNCLARPHNVLLESWELDHGVYSVSDGALAVK